MSDESKIFSFYVSKIKNFSKNHINKNIPMDEIHQKIINSVLDSKEFDDELHNMFVAVLLDMFIHKNDGLQFFYDRYIVTKDDFETFFKSSIIEYFDEDTYYELENQIGEI